MNMKGIIEKGESESLEFKEKFDKEAVESAVAFANAKGGIILIGVSDRGRIKGVKVGKGTLKEWVNKISQSTEPTIIPEIETYGMENKTIVAIAVKESPLKPVAYKSICFLRIGNSNKKLTPKEVSELYLQTIGSSWDAYPARDAKIEDIDYGRVEFYIKIANETGRRKITEEPLEVLRKLEVVKDDRPTWAAVLLFGKNPQGFLPQAKVHCGRFKNDITIIDDELIEGSIIEQVEKAMDFVKKHLKVRFEITGEARRKEIWEYPLDAVREAIINAVCHRYYTEASDIQIRIYDDELIVWSPGKLPLGISIEDLYKPHNSVLRNKLIAEVFFDIGFIERWGTGIQRMIDACKNQNLPEPSFEEYQGFRVIFRKDVYTQEYLRKLGLNERQINAVTFVKKEGKITNKKYQMLFEVSKRTASNELKEIKEKNIFEQIGKTGKGTYYVIKGE